MGANNDMLTAASAYDLVSAELGPLAPTRQTWLSWLRPGRARLNIKRAKLLPDVLRPPGVTRGRRYFKRADVQEFCRKYAAGFETA